MRVSASPNYLHDTNIILHQVRDNALAQWIEVTYVLPGVSPPPYISIVSVGELLSLASQFNWGTSRRQRLADILRGLRVLNLDEPGLVDAYAEIDVYSISVGKRMGQNDIWIAATAKATGTRLLTTDRDFDHLDGVHIERDWIDPASRLPATP
jgi:tRNA(fMet)-specific endonuclease VapC